MLFLFPGGSEAGWLSQRGSLLLHAWFTADDVYRAVFQSRERVSQGKGNGLEGRIDKVSSL